MLLCSFGLRDLLTDFLGVREFDLGVVDRDLDSCDLDFLPPSLLLELLLLDCDDDELLRLSLDVLRLLEELSLVECVEECLRRTSEESDEAEDSRDVHCLL